MHHHSRSQLIEFAKAYTGSAGLDALLSHFTHDGIVIEHGETATVPTLGKEFKGKDEIRAYFEQAFAWIDLQNEKIEQFTADPEVSRVACEGRVTMTWKETNQTWEEVFVYMLDFDHEGKVKKHQIWPDAGSMYLAKIGKLDEVRDAAKKTN